MDGLLANLFDALAHKFYNKDYRFVTPSEKKKIKAIWINEKEFKEHFSSVKELFRNLNPFGKNGEKTQAIIDSVVKVFGEYNIITHPASINKKECIEGKKEWIFKHLFPLPKNVYFPQNKAVFAITNNIPNILIDDFLPYIESWRAKGGYSIQMRTDMFKTEKEIKTFLLKQLNQAKEKIRSCKVDI